MSINCVSPYKTDSFEIIVTDEKSVIIGTNFLYGAWQRRQINRNHDVMLCRIDLLKQSDTNFVKKITGYKQFQNPIQDPSLK
jgi:hypothetical protein